VAAFGAVADVRSPEEQQQQQGKEEAKGPLTMQVPENELKEFTGQLSARCKAQFTTILDGKSAIHTFGDSGVQSKDSCTQLKGSLCSMKAEVTQQQEAQGRKLKSMTQVTGKSCLPEDCMEQNDLKVMATFMKVKARDALGASSVDTDINLHVDCVASGGSSLGATAGEAKERAPAEAKSPQENTVDNTVKESSSSARPGPSRSAAAPARSTIGVSGALALALAALAA